MCLAHVKYARQHIMVGNTGTCMESSKKPPQQPDATLPLFPSHIYYFCLVLYRPAFFCVFHIKLHGCIVAVVFRNLYAYTHTAIHNLNEKHMQTFTGWWGLVHAVNCVETVFKNSKYKWCTLSILYTFYSFDS